MRFKEIITERKTADLYHNTMYPVEILKSGKIKTNLDRLNDLEIHSDAKPFISLTRDPRFDFHGMGDAQFVIDQGKLANTHKIVPFDYGGYNDDGAYGRRQESEERVFKDIPLSYVKKIVVQSEYNVAAKEYIPLAKELGIPVVDKKGNRLEENFADGKKKIILYTDPNYYGAEPGDYKPTGSVVNIPVNKLVGFEPDKKMNQPQSAKKLAGIVSAIQQGDKMPPVWVRKYKNGYQVIDGHHRFWGHKKAGKTEIPAIIIPDQDIEVKDKVKENFADGKRDSKSSPGRVKRAGASCKGSVTSLRKKAKKYSGERGKMYHWCANMKSGRKKG